MRQNDRELAQNPTKVDINQISDLAKNTKIEQTLATNSLSQDKDVSILFGHPQAP